MFAMFLIRFMAGTPLAGVIRTRPIGGSLPMQTLLKLLVLLVLLTACASAPPFERDANYKPQPYPRDIILKDPLPVGDRLVWGGEVIALENLKDRTRIEILAYPLDARRRPMLDEPSQGRFLVEQAGYLEATDFPPRRLVTVYGTLQRQITGKVGEAAYQYPLLEAAKIHRWSLTEPRLGWGNVHFGIGISISN